MSSGYYPAGCEDDNRCPWLNYNEEEESEPEWTYEEQMDSQIEYD